MKLFLQFSKLWLLLLLLLGYKSARERGKYRVQKVYIMRVVKSCGEYSQKEREIKRERERERERERDKKKKGGGVGGERLER